MRCIQYSLVLVCTYSTAACRENIWNVVRAAAVVDEAMFECLSLLGTGKDWPGSEFLPTGANWQGFVWRGVQRNGQALAARDRNQDHRPRRSWRRDWRHPAGDHGPITVRQPLCHQVLWIISQGRSVGIQCIGVRMIQTSPLFLTFSLPYPSLPFFSFPPLPFHVLPLYPARGLAERCKLLQPAQLEHDHETHFLCILRSKIAHTHNTHTVLAAIFQVNLAKPVAPWLGMWGCRKVLQPVPHPLISTTIHS